MPTPPSVTSIVTDGGTGGVGPILDNSVLVLGTSSSGALATPTFVTPQTLVGLFGHGPGVALASHMMAVSGRPVYFAREDTGAGSDGSKSSVTPGAGNTSASTMTVDYDGGTGPNDTYDVIVTVQKGGTVGTDICRISISLDGGVQTAGGYVVPTTGHVVHIPNTDLKLTFTAATLVVGDTFSFTTIEPSAGLADLQDCLAAFGTSLAKASMVIDAGDWTGSDAATIQTDVDALTAPAIRRFVRFISSATRRTLVQSLSAWITAIETSFAGLDSLRGSYGAGLVRISDSTMKSSPLRPITWAYAARLLSVKPSESAARRLSGALSGLDPATIDYDERTVGGLTQARFVTAMTDPDLPGVFLAVPSLMSPPGSDFSEIQFGRVMDKVCTLTNGYFAKQLANAVRLNADGTILEKDAQLLEAGCNAILRAQVIANRDASAAVCTVSRTDVITPSTPLINVSVAVTPLGYLEQIIVTFGFQILQAAA